MSAVELEIARIHREELGRIVATLIRVVGDFSLAEEIAQEAFAAALEQWPRDGVPQSPAGWLVTTARHKAVDVVRRRKNENKKLEDVATIAAIEQSFTTPEEAEERAVPDDRLRLIFTCCHPALALEARIALTLRTLSGLSTEEIARAFLVSEATMAQRLVRAKNKIREAKIPYEVPEGTALEGRADTVMTVLYLIFSEGYAATKGEEIVRSDLADEAIRLTRLLVALLGESFEAEALLALMLLHDSRRSARQDQNGDLVLLEDQARSQWDKDEILEGLQRTESALRRCHGRPGRFSIQAAIAALHARATTAPETDWRQIAALYDILFRITPTPVVALNRVVARSFVHGVAAALDELAEIPGQDELAGYHLFHATRADFLRKLGHTAQARASFEKALELAQNEPERRFLTKRIRELTS